jgi:hypothetical protein
MTKIIFYFNNLICYLSKIILILISKIDEQRISKKPNTKTPSKPRFPERQYFENKSLKSSPSKKSKFTEKEQEI